MSTWARKNLNVVVYMRNRACSARAPPAAVVTRMMTAKCVGTNRKATITNIMMRGLVHPRDKTRQAHRARPASKSSSTSKAKGNNCLKHRLPKPYVKKLLPDGSGLHAKNMTNSKKKKLYYIKIHPAGTTTTHQDKDVSKDIERLEDPDPE